MYGKDSKRDKLESLQELKKNFDKYYSWKFVIWRQLYILLKILSRSFLNLYLIQLLGYWIPSEISGLQLFRLWGDCAPKLYYAG